MFYPIYINKDKKLSDGRRIAASKGCEKPTVKEIKQICDYLNIPAVVEVW